MVASKNVQYIWGKTCTGKPKRERELAVLSVQVFDYLFAIIWQSGSAESPSLKDHIKCVTADNLELLMRNR